MGKKCSKVCSLDIPSLCSNWEAKKCDQMAARFFSIVGHSQLKKIVSQHKIFAQIGSIVGTIQNKHSKSNPNFLKYAKW